ncbi:hypothetical protein AVEN_121689-1 [Araneus ventricosus]|uniref:F-box domain-containing protein n=1 Tax=Araneus ventricosus TaxID=182803 RepID=A0A4Y2MET1_ARAVE|nr:hypothetical protein AVEN_121689-1 [Araneus ventricosus]
MFKGSILVPSVGLGALLFPAVNNGKSDVSQTNRGYQNRPDHKSNLRKKLNLDTHLFSLFKALIQKFVSIFTSEIVSDADEIDRISVQYTEEKRDREIAQSIAANETEEFDKEVKWSELPSIPLEKIYSFLTREDQVNMSLVCRSWSEGYGSSSVWKTFRFALTESQLSMDSCPLMKFAQKYSNMFRHVEIICPYVENNLLVKNWCRYFVEFLQILTRNTQLISVKFRNFPNSLRPTDTPTYNVIYRTLAEFLASQHHLKRVEFDRCPFEYQESV